MKPETSALVEDASSLTKVQYELSSVERASSGAREPD